MAALEMSRVLIAVALVGLYGTWAARGVVAGAAYFRGVPLAASARYAEALPFLERAAAGSQRLEALWLRGEVRLGLWDRLDPARRGGEEGSRLLAAAASDYLGAAAACPASGWPWSGLAETYERLERLGRPERSFDLSSLREGRWAAIGRAGRVAVGMAKIAIEKEPSVAAHHDGLALILFRLGLEKEGLEAVRASAQVLPVFDAHAYSTLDPVPQKVFEVFVDGSRKALGNVPLLSRERHLLALGQLERRLGRLEQAETDFRAALRQPANAVSRAEDYFHLALVLMDRRRWREASDAFGHAARASVFRATSAVLQARIAEADGRPGEALEHLAAARALDARNLTLVLEYARLARRLGRWDRAVEALRWVIVLEPRQPGPWAELARTHLEAGDVAAAESVVWEMDRDLGPTPESTSLREELARRRTGGAGPGS